MRLLWVIALVAACSSAPGRVDDARDIDARADASVPSLVERAYLKSPHPAAGMYFGIGVALSSDGTTLAVAEGNAVDVFRRANQVWTLEQAIAVGVGNNGVGGNVIAISGAGDRIIAGALGSAAYVFVRAGTTWTQEGLLVPSGEQPIDFFGAAVAISRDGTTVVVGAYDEDSTHGAGGQTFTGAAHVFTRAGSTWSYAGRLLGSNTEPNDYFGWSVAASADGSTIAVGAYGEASNAAGIDGDQTNNSLNAAGAAYVFVRAGASYNQQVYLKSATPQNAGGFGWCLALADSGDALVVGAYNEGTGILGAAGSAYLFARTGTSWTQARHLTAAHPTETALFGMSVAISAAGTKIAVGASGEANRTGAATMFADVAGDGVHLVASNPDVLDEFGRTVALSADGATLALGAPGEASGSTDPHDNSAMASGAVYVFE